MKIKNYFLVGWREWIALPALRLPHIKAKVDTGARTSALHAFWLESFEENGVKKVRFAIHPKQYSAKEEVFCVADIFDIRSVSDSGGHREERFVIKTPIILGEHQWDIEITLTNRDTMAFRMLLGRTALKKHFVIHPSKSFLAGQPIRF